MTNVTDILSGRVDEQNYATLVSERDHLRREVARLTAERSQFADLARNNLAWANAAESRAGAAERELEKWRHYHPDDETLAELQKQAGDLAGKAATGVYVRALEHRVRELENGAPDA